MKCIFEKDIHIFRKQEKTNIVLPFTLPFDGEELKITFCYSPKILENEAEAQNQIKYCLIRDGYEEEICKWEEYLPLKNLITLSLDDPEGYRGCAHRHSPYQEHNISEKSASPGFLKGRIIKGEWKAVLNVHALVTQSCDVHIKVEAGGERYE